VNAVLILGDRFFTAGAGSSQGCGHRAGWFHCPWNAFPQPGSGRGWGVDGHFV